MVERTGPKCWIIRVKVMPEITTEPIPWNAIWNTTWPSGAVRNRPGTSSQHQQHASRPARR